MDAPCDETLSNHEAHEGHEGSDIIDYKLRALRVLRGQIFFFFFGCGFAAIRSL